jgi:hypothetical protein
MVEPQIVVLVVAGSSPVGHPSVQRREFQIPSSKLASWPLGFGSWDLGFIELCL